MNIEKVKEQPEVEIIRRHGFEFELTRTKKEFLVVVSHPSYPLSKPEHVSRSNGMTLEGMRARIEAGELRRGSAMQRAFQRLAVWVVRQNVRTPPLRGKTSLKLDTRTLSSFIGQLQRVERASGADVPLLLWGKGTYDEGESQSLFELECENTVNEHGAAVVINLDKDEVRILRAPVEGKTELVEVGQ